MRLKGENNDILSNYNTLNHNYVISQIYDIPSHKYEIKKLKLRKIEIMTYDKNHNYNILNDMRVKSQNYEIKSKL